jgi:hypothetical protein
MRLFQSSGHHGQLELLEMDVEPGFAVLMYGTIPKEMSSGSGVHHESIL